MKMWLRLGLGVGLCASAVEAVDWIALKPQGYVSDFAQVVDPANRVRLEAYCGAVERSTGAQIALVIVPSLAGEPVADVAQTLYRAWAVGQKNQPVGQRSQPMGQQNQGGGVLVLMAVYDRRVRLATARSLESILPESGVLREMRPALRERDFGEAAMAAAETIGRTVAQARKVTLSASLPRRLRPGPFDWFPWPVLIGAVLRARTGDGALHMGRQRQRWLWRLRFGRWRLRLFRRRRLPGRQRQRLVEPALWKK